MYSGLDGAFKAFIIFFCLISAVVGWAVIESLIWFFHHLSFAWS